MSVFLHLKSSFSKNIEKKVLIVGGGISGLSLSYFLTKFSKINPNNIFIIEKNNCLGGNLHSSHIKKENLKFYLEKSARCLNINSGSLTLDLIRQLKLEDKIFNINSVDSKRYIYKNKSMIELKIKDLFPTSIWHLLNCLINDFLVNDIKIKSDISIYEFIEYKLGKELANNIEPIILGIYAGDITKLSMKSCFSNIYNIASKSSYKYKSFFYDLLKYYRKERKIKKSNIQLYSLKNGLSTLINSIRDYLKLNKVNVICNANIDLVSFNNKNDKNHMEIRINNRLIEFTHVITTVGMLELEKIINKSDIKESEQKNNLIKYLKSIKYAPIISVHLIYKRKSSNDLKNGFGCLIPSSENESILGISYNSNIYDTNKDIINFTVMLGGYKNQKINEYSTEKLESIAKESIRNILNIRSNPVFSRLEKNYIPQYNVGHNKIVNQIESCCKNIFPQFYISGWSIDGISVNERIKRSYELFKKIDE